MTKLFTYILAAGKFDWVELIIPIIIFGIYIIGSIIKAVSESSDTKSKSFDKNAGKGSAPRKYRSIDTTRPQPRQQQTKHDRTLPYAKYAKGTQQKPVQRPQPRRPVQPQSPQRTQHRPIPQSRPVMSRQTPAHQEYERPVIIEQRPHPKQAKRVPQQRKRARPVHINEKEKQKAIEKARQMELLKRQVDQKAKAKPKPKPAEKHETSADVLRSKLENVDELKAAIVYSEILSKPLALREGHLNI